MEAINITCSTKDQLPLDALEEFQGGLKERSDADYNKIIKSIKNYGFSFPFFVWKHDGINSLIDGHGRLGALQRMQAKGIVIPELPVVYVNCKDEEDAKNLLLRLNSHYGTMTAESVAEFMDGLEINIEDLALPSGILDFNINIEPEETEDDDEIPDVQEEVVSQYGEIYELGDSLLMCGDSTKEEDVARLMGNEKADMVFTDPPYGMNLDTDYSSMKNKLNFAKEKGFTGGKKYEQGKVDEFHPEFIKNIFSIFSYCKEIFLWGADYFSEFLEEKNNGCWIVWDKRANGNNDDKSDESSDKMYGSCFELCWSKNKHKRDIARVKWAGVFGTEKEFDHKRYHPTQKPIKLIEWFLSRYSAENQIIVDLFGGSGSTLLGCEKLNRRARLMELDPHYCDVIRRRYTQWAKENGRPITSGCLE